jgi:poly(3-hydroxybutyrate) depolymerase
MAATAKGRSGMTRAVSMLVSSLAVLSVLAPGTARATTPATPTTPAPPETGHPVMTPMSGSYVIHLTFDGLHRDYRIHVPPQAASGRPLPMVINMAGATQNGQIEEILSDMDPNADENGYLAVYPDGTRISKVLTPDPVAKQAQYAQQESASGALGDAGDPPVGRGGRLLPHAPRRHRDRRRARLHLGRRDGHADHLYTV